MKEKIKRIMEDAVQELNEQLSENEKISYNEEVRLIGKSAALDSMAFVTLITIIEELIEDELNRTIEIVSDKAFSREHSPFYSMKSLTDFIVELLGEE